MKRVLVSALFCCLCLRPVAQAPMECAAEGTV